MGRMLISATENDDKCELTAVTVRPGSDAEKAGSQGITELKNKDVFLTSDLAGALGAVDVAIDFTLPEATELHLAAALSAGTPIVIGTTGLSDDQENQIKSAASDLPIVFAANMSAGVTVLLDLVARAAAALDDAYDIEIVEMHHNRKVDAPSGTALALGKSAAEGRSVDFDTAKQLSREGRTGPRPAGQIGFATMRGGTVIGDHTVCFAGPGERVEISHKAGGREIYASGAVAAAKWLTGQGPGLYDMRDVLGLSDA